MPENSSPQFYSAKFLELRRAVLPISDDRYHDERDKLIVRAWEDGYSMQSIADFIGQGFTRQRVSQIMQERGHSAKETLETVDQEYREKAVALATEGKSLFEIAATLEIPYTKVRRLLKTAGVVAPRPAKPLNPKVQRRNQKLLELYQSGRYTHEDLAKRFKRNPVYLGRVLNEMGVGRDTEAIKKRNEKILGMRERGIPIAKIAKKFDMLPQSVSNLLGKLKKKG